MNFTLTRFDSQQVEIDSENIITFPQGIPPFDDCTRYNLFHEEDKSRVFFLQSLDDADLMFSVADPMLFKLSYDVMLNEEEQRLLKLEQGDELLLAVILFRDEKTEGDQVNPVAKAPIVLNIDKRIGLQKFLTEFDARVVVKGM